MPGDVTMSNLSSGREVRVEGRELMLSGDHEPLIDYETLGQDALLSARLPIIICRCFTFSDYSARTTQ
jgi:hypothetical protein